MNITILVVSILGFFASIYGIIYAGNQLTSTRIEKQGGYALKVQSPIEILELYISMNQGLPKYFVVRGGTILGSFDTREEAERFKNLY